MSFEFFILYLDYLGFPTKFRSAEEFSSEEGLYQFARGTYMALRKLNLKDQMIHPHDFYQYCKLAIELEDEPCTPSEK